MDCAQVVGAGEEGRGELLWEYSAKSRLCFVWRRLLPSSFLSLQAIACRIDSAEAIASNERH